VLSRIAAVIILIALTATTIQVVGRWRDSVTLFSHVIKVTRDNSFAEWMLGAAMDSQGNTAGAIPHMREAARTSLWQVGGNNVRASWGGDIEIGLGSALVKTAKQETDNARQQDEMREAARHLRQGIAMNTRTAPAYNNLASALSLLGDTDGAIKNYEAALQITPDDYETLMNLGAVLARTKRLDEAAKRFRAAAALNGTSVEPQIYLALVLAQTGKRAEAADALERAMTRDARATNDFLTSALHIPPSESNARDWIARLRQ
jgi:tetratricopeptide (TPR) repeat protein